VTPTPIASVEISALAKDGGRFNISLQIGAPYQRSDFPDEWSCSVSLTPLHSHLRDRTGSDAFQAICLAVRFAIALLTQFKADGGKLLCSDGGEFPLEAYLGASLPGNYGA
jgi:hypothetical protein